MRSCWAFYVPILLNCALLLTATHDDTLQAAQQQAREYLERARTAALGGDGRCRQRLPFFIERVVVHNFGDELNVDLGAAMLGMATHELDVVTVRELKTKERLGKVLAIGSVFGRIETGDVIVGAGVKHRARDNLLLIHSDVIDALKSKQATMHAVRGPRSCKALQSKGLTCPACYGDPALVLGMLSPVWGGFALRWRSNSTLCVLPHSKDTKIREAAEALASDARHNVRVLSTQTLVPSDLQGCALLAASALHGIIIADAMRLPSVWLGEYSMGRTSADERVGFLNPIGDAPRNPANQPPFKYLDYFAGIEHAPQRVGSVTGALELKRRGTIQPRLSAAELLSRE